LVQEQRGHVDVQDVNTSETYNRIVENLRQVYDPEISVNIYDLGLIYNITVNDSKCDIVMSLTSPFCPAVDQILEDVNMAAYMVPDIKEVSVDITFTPQWGPEMMSEDAKLILGIY
jgi:metal-sulfur cluster biosynthetic enzyme